MLVIDGASGSWTAHSAEDGSKVEFEMLLSCAARGGELGELWFSFDLITASLDMSGSFILLICTVYLLFLHENRSWRALGVTITDVLVRRNGVGMGRSRIRDMNLNISELCVAIVCSARESIFADTSTKRARTMKRKPSLVFSACQVC
ncbi:MAG: hypothetical protein CL912_28510 [Deltaproteobacteria bacterium]|nr:hypothetical protein [Deltaproteobacteria bacterium]